MIYQNQDEVGAALKKVIPSVVKREELFITSKLWNSAHQPREVEKELDETLSQLGLEYLDLYCMWPSSFDTLLVYSRLARGLAEVLRFLLIICVVSLH